MKSEREYIMDGLFYVLREYASRVVILHTSLHFELCHAKIRKLFEFWDENKGVILFYLAEGCEMAPMNIEADKSDQPYCQCSFAEILTTALAHYATSADKKMLAMNSGSVTLSDCAPPSLELSLRQLIWERLVTFEC